VIEEASETMIDVAMRINEIKRQHERWLRAQEVHNALTGDHRVDVVELGDLVLEVPSFDLLSLGLTVIKTVYTYCFKGRLSGKPVLAGFLPSICSMARGFEAESWCRYCCPSGKKNSSVK